LYFQSLVKGALTNYRAEEIEAKPETWPRKRVASGKEIEEENLARASAQAEKRSSWIGDG